MAFRFNNGNGCLTCDTCDTIVTYKGTMLTPTFITVNLADKKEAHFCSEAHLDDKIESVTAALAHPEHACDDLCFGADGLASMIALRQQINEADMDTGSEDWNNGEASQEAT